jgi:hypothetical protein
LLQTSPPGPETPDDLPMLRVRHLLSNLFEVQPRHAVATIR